MAWFHDLSPFLIEFSPGMGVRWYGLSYAVGFLLGWFWLRRLSRTGVTPMSETRITDAMLTLVMGVVLGGRLGYVFFYEPKLLVTFTDSIPWWGVLQLNKGGMASHGGMIGVGIACWIIARGPKGPNGLRSERVPMLHVYDCAALAGTPGLGLGRIANFINGELLGRIAAQPGEPSPAWSVKFPQEVVSGHAPTLSPEQSAALVELVRPFAGESGVSGRNFDPAYERMLAVIQSGSQQGKELAAKLEPLISARHPSQLYQCFAEAIVVGLGLWIIWRKPRPAGVITASFMILYGIGRILTELVRLPDTHLHISQVLGLSRGQWLSVLMVVTGAGLLTFVTLRSQRNPSIPRFGRTPRQMADE